MISFRINHNHTIESLDEKNWGLVKYGVAGDKSSNPGAETRSILGYFGNLEHAWRRAASLLAVNCDDNLELSRTLEMLKEIKKPFEEFARKNK